MDKKQTSKPYTVESVGRGKARQVLVRQGPHQWLGKDLKNALAQRNADIDRMLAERYTDPVLLRLPDGEIAVAHCALGGWNYQKYEAAPRPNGEVQLRYGGSYQTGRSRHACERDMRRHAADLAIKIGAESDGWPILCDGLIYLRDSVCEAEDISAQLARVAFVRGFLVAKARGLSDSATHEAGCKASDDMRKRTNYFHRLSLVEAFIAAGTILAKE